MPALILLAIFAAAALAIRAHQRGGQVAPQNGAPDPSRAWGDAADLAESIGATMRTFWTPPRAASPYLESIGTAAAVHGVPDDLLARVLYQESRFRADIISGATRSKAGAVGIGQFMPDTALELGIDPLDPDQAIDGTAKYLKRLRDRFGSWADAVAAYNWGPGNWTAFLETGRGAKGQARPQENIDYVAQIGADVALA